jgi:hypothetical protein
MRWWSESNGGRVLAVAASAAGLYGAWRLYSVWAASEDGHLRHSPVVSTEGSAGVEAGVGTPSASQGPTAAVADKTDKTRDRIAQVEGLVQSVQQPRSCDSCNTANTSARTKLHRCRQCKKAWYCDRQCQQRGWPAHKIACGAVSQIRQAQQTFKVGNVREAAGLCTVVRSSVERALAQAAPAPDRVTRWLLSSACRLEGDALTQLGQLEPARALYHSAVAHAEAAEEWALVAFSMTSLAGVLEKTGGSKEQVVGLLQRVSPPTGSVGP